MDGRTSASADSMSAIVTGRTWPDAMESIIAFSAAVAARCSRSAPENPSVRRTTAPRSIPATGRPARWWRRMASRAGSSGGRTSTTRSNRPGRRSAVSTSHGWLVAPSTNRPSLSEPMPSISWRSWLTTVRMPDEPEYCARLPPIASTSSRNRTAGASCRARWNRAWRFCSLSPMYLSRMSASVTVRNRAPSSPATARAMYVLPVPGGP
ncbi:Uncharacterised protein [Mycobacteroides abscessus]|nr:Uncharacterised protein [Mycobacteroides abscessus]